MIIIITYYINELNENDYQCNGGKDMTKLILIYAR